MCDGVHRLADCLFCDKKNIRSDNFKVHFESHLKKSTAKNALEFSNEHNIDLVDDILIKKIDNADPEKVRYPYGSCYSCHRVVYNKDPTSIDDFCNHVCKEKKEAQVKKQTEEKMKCPPDFKALWEKIGTNKMSDAARMRYDDMPELCSDDHGEEKYNIMIAYFISRILSSDKTRAAASATGDGLMSLKKNPVLKEKFELDENDDDILNTILSMAKGETAIINTYARKMAKQERELTSEIDALNSQLYDSMAELNRVKDNALYYAQEARNAASEITALKQAKTNSDTIEHVD